MFQRLQDIAEAFILHGQGAAEFRSGKHCTLGKQRQHLEVVAERRGEPQPSLSEQVLALLAEGTVLTRAKLRGTLAVKNERLGDVLESLEQAGRLRHTPAGWQRLD